MGKHAGQSGKRGVPHIHALTVALAILACACAATPTPPSAAPVDSPASLSAIAEDAYIWAYPMLQNYQTLYRMTVHGDRKLNELSHRRKLLDPSFKTIVGPNNDTLYSSAWLDLRHGPVRITVPPISGDRYWSIQFIDLLVHNFAYVGSRATGSAGGTYVIAGPADRDAPVTGAEAVFQSESNFVFAIVRILADDVEDARAVNALQDRFVLAAPAPSKDAVTFVPFDPAAAQTHEFISIVNFLLLHIDLHPQDRKRVERYAAIGIGANDSATRLQSAAMTASIEEGIKRAMQRIDAKAKEIGQVVDGWSTTVRGFGSREQIAGDLLAKAAAAKIGLYGNSREENISWIAQTDAVGKSLDGAASRYTVRLERDQLPPARAFWSLTLYQMPDVLLYANQIQRYSIGDRTRDLKFDEDGALTLYIQHERPDDKELGNWLPAPAGPFSLALRMYLPSTDAAAQTWHPPALMANTSK